MFPTKMKEKDTELALGDSSLMIKSVEFSIYLKKSKCNSIFLNYFTKWVEAKPLANIRDTDVKRFV